jgi:hypothetical protein
MIQRSSFTLFEFDPLPLLHDLSIDTHSPFGTTGVVSVSSSDEENSQSSQSGSTIPTMNVDDTSSSFFKRQDISLFDESSCHADDLHDDDDDDDDHQHHMQQQQQQQQQQKHQNENQYVEYTYDEDDNDIKVRFLPSDYTPSDTDVVCARGKAYWDHKGNCRYRYLIGQAIGKYSASTNKLEKTLIVTEIINAVHTIQGKFIKKQMKGGPWVEVDDVFAREKVGQSLRDGLTTKYRSATKAKQARRNDANERFNGDIDKVIHSNQKVSERINKLIHDVKQTNGGAASDDCIMTLFNRANSDILETIKNDATMLSQFQDASFAANADGN